MNKYTPSLKGTWNNIKKSLPILLAIILLISLVINYIPKNFYNKVFIGNNLVDSFVGAVFGSIAAGNPVNSYIIGTELLKQNVDLIAVVAFIIAWVTVGIIQFPAEALLLGKKFALTRNVASFFSAIIISVLTVLFLNLI